MYDGHYINLDRNPERRAAIEEQFALLDPRHHYARFPAVDGNLCDVDAPGLSAGEIGCLLSHYMLLESRTDGAAHLHVVEDDVVLTKRAVLFLEQVIGAGILDDHDILFTETAVHMDLPWCREARRHYKTLIERAADGTVSGVTFRLIPFVGGTASYLVNRRSVRLVCDILGQELDRGARRPIDILLRDAVIAGLLRARSLFPFVSTIRPPALSTIERDDGMRKSRFAMEMLRHSFFVDCDPLRALDLTRRWLARADADPHERLHSRLADFIGSDIFRDH